MHAFADSDHAGDHLTRRSQTGYFVFLNRALLYCHSKKQTSVEISSFGCEFMAMKHTNEYSCGLQYKLRMMGIELHGCTYVYGYNQSVLENTCDCGGLVM